MSAFIEPLKLLHENGTPYERHTDVNAELGTLLALNYSERAAEAPRAHSESLAHFIRHRTQADEEFHAIVFQEITKRIVRAARSVVRSLPKSAAEEIVNNVEMQILKLLVANSQDPAGDFFEVGFAQGVEARTRDAKRGYLRSVTGGRRSWLATDETDESGDEIDPLELVADNAAGPEGSAIAKIDQEYRRELFERVRPMMKDPRYIEAAVLFFFEGWPIQSKDPDKECLVRYFRATDSQIRHWISVVVKAIRELLIEDAAKCKSANTAP